MLRKMIVINAPLCTGCIQCELVCSINKSGWANPLCSRIRVAKDLEKGIFLPMVCRQCNPAPCVEMCPQEALQRSLGTGTIRIDPTRCNHCQACVSACPFGAINVAPDESINICDLCGGDPMCVKFCKERPEDTCTYLSNPKASALEYVEITEASTTARRTQLRKMAQVQEREE